MNLFKTVSMISLCSFLLTVTSTRGLAQQPEKESFSRAETVRKAASKPEKNNVSRSSASLEETVNLLKNILETEAQVIFIKDPQLGFSPGGLKQFKATVKDCAVELDSRERSYRKIIFQFKDIDPDSINLEKSSYNHYLSNLRKIVVNSYALSFKSLEMQKSFIYTDDNPPLASGLREYSGSSLQIAFPRTDDFNAEERETAQKFAMAFRYAVGLCGKKQP